MGKLEEAIIGFAQDLSIDSLRKKSHRFNALCSLDECLRHIAKNRIAPTTKDGKHVCVDLQEILATFNQEFMRLGVNPNLSVNWELCDPKEEFVTGCDSK